MTFQLDSIVAGYGPATVLHDVTVVVPRPSVVALLGANGAGKTTLLRVASGLLSPRRGRVVLDGVDLTALSTAKRVSAGLCHVPEGAGVFRALTVRENLLLQAPRSCPDPVGAALEAFPQLASLLGQRAGTLSGGQQRSLALARVLLTRPSVALLDEVSLGLSPVAVDDVYAHLSRLTDAGITLLLVEQYVPRALALADYVYILGRGRVVFAGEPTELDEAEVFSRYLGTTTGGDALAGASPERGRS